MKETNLFLVGVVLLLGFAGIAFAEVDNTSLSFENDTVVGLSPGDDFASPNETNETDIVNESDMVVEDLIVDDLLIDGLVIEDRESSFDKILSYIGGKVDRLNEINGNLVLVVIVIGGVLLLFIFSILYGDLSAATCFSRASSLHRRATIAHVNGNYAKAKRLYSKSYLLREKGEKRVGSEN